MDQLVSVIIPCYNSGEYLEEAVESVRRSTYKNIEIILVDDGSTDKHTIDILDTCKELNYKVIWQSNAGPAAARNAGVKNSGGAFLFFLDSDNKTRPDYISKAVQVFNQRQEVGVVYGNAFFFGDSSMPRFRPGEFDIDRMLVGNYIDMCAFVRKSLWGEVGGFDEMLFGCEDWEFWLRVGMSNWKFHFIDSVLFDYRIRHNSHTAIVDFGPKKEIARYISKKHSELIYMRFKYFFRLNKRFNSNPFLYFTQVFYYKYFLRKKYPTK